VDKQTTREILTKNTRYYAEEATVEALMSECAGKAGLSDNVATLGDQPISASNLQRIGVSTQRRTRTDGCGRASQHDGLPTRNPTACASPWRRQGERLARARGLVKSQQRPPRTLLGCMNAVAGGLRRRFPALRAGLRCRGACTPCARGWRLRGAAPKAKPTAVLIP
jgi:hypothetical protein